MNNEELESRLLLIKQSIDVLQEELAPNLKTKDLVLLRYGYNVDEIKKLNNYLFMLTTENKKVTKREFESKLCEIRNLPNIPKGQVNDVLEGYRNSNLHVDVVKYILNNE
ncbi:MULTISPECIES: hypothetical protein [Staphylococcus]|uniref:Conserved cytoplasmic protein n=1 Tax=Staphylococcus schleiferi TaxID=1295 RepID=A0A7Z7VW52_STASC|nr:MULTISPECIES: hypothetical protein [Staphylococcus]QGS46479.1 hypothetical protein FOB90_07165 [Mammaliicoccus fleurettii]EPD50100.1 hypothetical protein HMPREF1208_01638 [Staphylococcus sp. HGB0015]MBF1992065.1 hypothetical protein [Staphylococcus schleiferi]MBF2037515.1 hypothetical protein [Staphylococcus schleiferi]MBF2099541.1 hypothetical protein [Staphylococcus schleiferi]